jgi:nucleoside-diphosphate-sugar epimerase
MKILVTGGAGLIGNCCVKALRNAGFETISLDRQGKATSHEKRNDKIIVDLLESDAFNKINQLDPDTIIHCAANIPRQFLENDIKELSSKNRQIDSVISNLSNKRGCRIIFISSASLYGFGKDRIDEQSPINPIGWYLYEKHQFEKDIIADKGKGNVVLRISSPYGIEQVQETVLHFFIKKAIASEPITFYGSGERRQDFVAVDDIASAVINSVNHSDARGIFNIASGRSISMKNLAYLIKSLVPECRSNVLPADIEDPQENYRADFDISKAREELGWRPQVSLEDGIKSLIDHYLAVR